MRFVSCGPQTTVIDAATRVLCLAEAVQDRRDVARGQGDHADALLPPHHDEALLAQAPHRAVQAAHRDVREVSLGEFIHPNCYAAPIVAAVQAPEDQELQRLLGREQPFVKRSYRITSFGSIRGASAPRWMYIDDVAYNVYRLNTWRCPSGCYRRKISRSGRIRASQCHDVDD